MSSKHNCKVLAETLGSELLNRKFTLSTAESCTGGMIGAAITATPGSSAWFRGGIIAYENRIKQSLLDVPGETLEKHGAVSRETVAAMVSGAANKLGTDCAIAVSGIAGPDGGTAEKPVGLVYIGIYCEGDVTVEKNVFSGDREEVRLQTVEKGLHLCIKKIRGESV